MNPRACIHHFGGKNMLGCSLKTQLFIVTWLVLKSFLAEIACQLDN